MDKDLVFVFGNTWPPSSSTHLVILTHHPLRLYCGLSRHASHQPQQSTMASFGKFACPLVLLDSHLGLHLHVAALEENLSDDRLDFEDCPPPFNLVFCRNLLGKLYLS